MAWPAHGASVQLNSRVAVLSGLCLVGRKASCRGSSRLGLLVGLQHGQQLCSVGAQRGIAVQAAHDELRDLRRRIVRRLERSQEASPWGVTRADLHVQHSVRQAFGVCETK